ncbi:MAG TPA: MBL fold metallo-hydrolase [Bacteroides sp.]|nr:MBL fold metallo-hydrolase [Bacteroides sp.]
MGRLIHGIGLIIIGLMLLSANQPGTVPERPDDAMKITIIYDNYPGSHPLETDWGFACRVEYLGDKLLFDSGGKADLYQKNAEALKVSPEDFPALFISHAHGDHTGGMGWIVERNPSIMCYLPATFAMQLKNRGSLPERYMAVAEPTHLFGPFYSTGDQFDQFPEQGLVVRTGQGGVLVTGCGHPGVLEMVSKVKEEMGIGLHAVIGGLHLLRTSDREVQQIAEELKQMGIRYICPTHCTGDKAIGILKASFGEGYIAGGTGTEIVIE